MLNSIIMPEPIPHSDGVSINHPDQRFLPQGEREKRESYLRDSLGFSQEKINKLKEIKAELYSAESIIEKINGLKDRGFTNPNKMIESSPTILSLTFENIDTKISGLKDRGFTNPNKMIASSPVIFTLAFENIDAKLSGLKDRGFTNPNKMIESLPAIFSYAFENIDAKLSGLKDRGFTNPNKMIESLPPILGYTFENIDTKISGLKDRGFTNPNKMIESSPTILGLAFENIDTKISGLKDRGFTNPNKMIESSPTILSHGFESIDSKISGLKDRGFTNPNKMIESSPAIFSYAFESIDSKISLLSKLNNLYQININPITTIESNLPILGTKFEKLIVIARVLREYQPSPEDVQRKIGQLYTLNIESLLISYSQKEPSDNIDDLTRTARQIQKQKLSKDYKRQLIKDFFNQNPDSYKIYRDYLKGYPEKTQDD